jgi:hypothetical protein
MKKCNITYYGYYSTILLVRHEFSIYLLDTKFMVQTLKWKINTLIFESFDMRVWSVWEFESQIGLNGLAQRIRSRPTSKALARWGDGFKKWRMWRDTWSNLKRPDRSGGCFSFRSIYIVVFHLKKGSQILIQNFSEKF